MLYKTGIFKKFMYLYLRIDTLYDWKKLIGLGSKYSV